jgi:mannosyltransferase OCH1-like enzyme
LKNQVIQCLWIGNEISAMERLSLASFLAHGHRVHLYVYGNVAGVPRGVTLWDANEILPADRIFQYAQHKSYAGFANFFRYKLLLDRGGWWVDTDTVCLRPFDFAAEHVFPTEWTESPEPSMANSPLKAPRGSIVMRYAWRVCQSKDTQTIGWGETGPLLIAEAVRSFSLDGYAMAPQVFLPIPYLEWQSVLDPARTWEFGPETYSIHLWNEMWRRHGQEKNARYDPGCLYEQLKRRYL